MANTKAKYVVIVLSLEPWWLRHNPNSARLRLRILKKATFDKIRKDNSPQPTLDKKYRRWVKKDGQRTCSTMSEGWMIAKQWKTEIESRNRKVDLIDPPGYQVYVMEMKKTVWDHPKFSKFEGQPLKKNAIGCCYVGLTSSKPEKRFYQHRSKNHKASTEWGQKFFKETFKEAYRKDLLSDYKNEGYEWDNLLASDAYRTEEHLTHWLQKRGIGAYFN